MKYDHQFHLAIVDYIGNREFQQMFQRLMYLIHLTTAGALSVPGRTEDTLKAVSYTHLDVYKRQYPYRTGGMLLIAVCFLSGIVKRRKYGKGDREAA